MKKDDAATVDRSKTIATTFSADLAVTGLKLIIEMLGYSLFAMTTKEKGDIAERLSKVIGQSPPWSWRYVHNVLAGKVNASKKFTEAVLRVGALFDGANAMMVEAHSVQVFAFGNVKPGAIVLSDSRLCVNPSCPVEFVPRVPNQRYCCPACSQAARKSKRSGPG